MLGREMVRGEIEKFKDGCAEEQTRLYLTRRGLDMSGLIPRYGGVRNQIQGEICGK